jgi:hypothetical protein
MEKNMDSESRITVKDENGSEIGLDVLEETKVNGMYYLLATDAEENEDGECYVLKDVSKPEETEAVYEFVTDENELDYMFQIFKELMDGSDVTLSK